VGNTLKVTEITPLFQADFRVFAGYSYDVSANGQRFLVNTSIPQGKSLPMTVVVNWPETLPTPSQSTGR
jgi:hypothetical protein